MSAQIQMFEPQGQTLANLVRVHCGVAEVEQRRAENLALCGFLEAARSRLDIAKDAVSQAYVCEMALQFEQLAILS